MILNLFSKEGRNHKGRGMYGMVNPIPAPLQLGMANLVQNKQTAAMANIRTGLAVSLADHKLTNGNC